MTVEEERRSDLNIMKGLFIPNMTVERFKNGWVQSYEAIYYLDECEMYEIEYDPESANCDSCYYKMRVKTFYGKEVEK